MAGRELGDLPKRTPLVKTKNMLDGKWLGVAIMTATTESVETLSLGAVGADTSTWA